MNDIGLIDIWREMFPDARQYTHYSSAHSVHTRIDYFIIFSRDRSRIIDSEIGTMNLSDHAPIFLTLNLESYRRNTTWRFNTSLLNDPSFKKQMTNEIQMYIKENVNGETTAPTIWDAAKAVLWGKIIAVSSHKKKVKAKKTAWTTKPAKATGGLSCTESGHKDSKTNKKI